MDGIIEYEKINERATSGNAFQTPPPVGDYNKDYSSNQAYELGSKLTLQWTSNNFNSLIMQFRQDLPCVSGVTPCGYFTTLFENAGNANAFDWTVDPKPYNLTTSSVFYFVLYNGTVSDSSAFITSHYFNITDPAHPSQTPSSFTISTSSSSSGATSAPTTTAVPANSTAISTPKPALSSGAKAGIGISVGGISAIFVFALLMFLRYRKRGDDKSPEKSLKEKISYPIAPPESPPNSHKFEISTEPSSNQQQPWEGLQTVDTLPDRQTPGLAISSNLPISNNPATPYVPTPFTAGGIAELQTPAPYTAVSNLSAMPSYGEREWETPDDVRYQSPPPPLPEKSGDMWGDYPLDVPVPQPLRLSKRETQRFELDATATETGTKKKFSWELGQKD